MENDPDIQRWRREQQAEWDRISQSLALLATMNAAILAISPHPQPLAFSLWLSGAGLSVSGLFVVQYFAVKAFNISDQDMKAIVGSESSFIDQVLLATTIITPIVSASWSAILFGAGIVSYILTMDFPGVNLLYRILGLLPILSGLVAMGFALWLGERTLRRVELEYKPRPLEKTATR